MSREEVWHRFARALRTRIESVGLLSARPVRGHSIFRSGEWVKSDAMLALTGCQPAADEIMQGRIRVFARAVTFESQSWNWNRDPLTGRQAPLDFGKHIDYRDQSLVGDIKYLWEINRHLEMPTLAQAFARTGDERYLAGIRTQLESWIEQCPYALGVNWTSSLELAIRLVNWSLTWQLIGQSDSPLFRGEDGARLRARWLSSVYQHVHFIHHFYSRYSSANNHLIGEAAGVSIATRTWPCWQEFESWGAQARQILVQEAAAQTHADGVNREQAIAYQQFVLDFLLLAGLAERANGNDFPAGYWETIERMTEFLHSMMDVSGNTPMIGDADDGYVVRLSQDPAFCPFRSLLATGAILFRRPDFAAASGGLDDKTRMLVDTRCWEELWQAGQAMKHTPRQAYPDGGYFILVQNPASDDEVRLTADAGPLGYLSIAAHGHADALAIVLSVAGREILVDPGTYAYHTKPVWREYFRGTGAHNTVRVDGLDQSVQGGNFMWLQHARASCAAFRPTVDGGLFAGEHDGYRRLPDPVTHQREVEMRSNAIEITDRLLCGGVHVIERCWHFSEHCQVTLEGDRVVAECGSVRVTLRAAEPVRRIRRLRGSEDPPGGWVSRHFDVKVPSDSIYFVSDIEGDCELKTLIEWEIRSKDRSDEA